MSSGPNESGAPVFTDESPVATLTTGPPARTGRHANSVLVLAFLSLAGLSYAVLQSLVAPAMPAIAKDLHASSGDITWILTAYLLVASVLTPIAGRLGDMFGKRLLMLIVLVILAAGTLAAALATNLGVLIAARAVQGAAGAVVPLSIGIIRDEFPRHRVVGAVGLLSALFGIGAGLGIVLAGPIVDHLSWHWLFWFPLMAIVLAVAGIAFGVPESPVRTPGRIDVLGAVLLSLGLAPMLLAISKGQQWGWTSTRVLGLFAIAVVALVAWVLAERRAAEPLVDMRMMVLRGVWTTNVVGMAFGFVMFGLFVLIPQLLELPSSTGYGFGKTVTAAGLFMLPTTIAMMLFGPLAGVLDRHAGVRTTLALAAGVGTLGFVLPAIAHSETWQLFLMAWISGAAVGIALAAMANAIIAAVPQSQTGVATSMNAIARTIGGSVGSAVVAEVLTTNPGPFGIPTNHAFSNGFWVCAVVAMVALLASLALPGRKHAGTPA